MRCREFLYTGWQTELGVSSIFWPGLQALLSTAVRHCNFIPLKHCDSGQVTFVFLLNFLATCSRVGVCLLSILSQSFFVLKFMIKAAAQNSRSHETITFMQNTPHRAADCVDFLLAQKDNCSRHLNLGKLF